MKHLVLFSLLSAMVVSSKAQISTDFDLARHTNARKTTAVNFNAFSGTEMEINNNLLSFTDLPVLPKPIWAVITNKEGEFIKQGKVNPAFNAMDIHNLSKGLYFVTLVYRNKNQKAFVLNVGE